MEIDNLSTTATGMIRLLMTTQAQVDTFSDQVIESVKAGEVNPLEILVQLKAFEKASERIIKEIKDNLLTEAEKHPEEKFSFAGADITKADVYTKYDYSVCKDPAYDHLVKIQAQTNEQIKERETFLKGLKTPLTTVDEGSGELITLSPPAIKRTPGLKVSIK